MKRLFQTVCVFFLLFNLPYAQGTVAVAQLDALGISSAESRALTDRLRFELHSSGNFQVIERALMDEILKEQGFQQTGCVSDECVVEVGKLLGAESMVGGSISKVGSTYSVSIRTISVETGEILGSAQKDFKGEIDYLLTDGMAIITNDLITSLGAKQLRKYTTTKMPLQNFPAEGFFISEINLLLKSFIYTGLGFDLSTYKKKNLFSINIAWYELEYKGALMVKTKYSRFLTGLSIPLPTLKGVQILTPLVLSSLEYTYKTAASFAYDSEVADSEVTLKVGLGLTTDISTKYTIYSDFAFNIVTSSRYEKYITGNPVLDFGIIFTQLSILSGRKNNLVAGIHLTINFGPPAP